jgi:hypothetical protein
MKTRKTNARGLDRAVFSSTRIELSCNTDVSAFRRQGVERAGKDRLIRQVRHVTFLIVETFTLPLRRL